VKLSSTQERYVYDIEWVFKDFGLPKAIRTDNEPSPARTPPTASASCLASGVLTRIEAVESWRSVQLPWHYRTSGPAAAPDLVELAAAVAAATVRVRGQKLRCSEKLL
jgi:hypothetical protein